jgi:hypothetical protein
VNSRGDIHALTNNLVTGAPLEEGCVLRSQERPSILLIDEVDVFFSRDFYGETYNPAALIQARCTGDVGYIIAQAQYTIWAHREHTPGRIITEVWAMPEYKRLAEMIGKEQLEILKAHFQRMAADVKSFHDPEYTVLGQRIGYSDPVLGISFVKCGYRTLFAYFNEVEKGTIDQQVLDRELGVTVYCGNFSYADIPNSYEQILGVTGTLSSLGEFEKYIIKNEYNIPESACTSAPSIYGSKATGVFKKNEGVSVLTDKDEWHRSVQDTVLRMHPRPVLVFFEDDDAMREWESSAYAVDNAESVTTASDQDIVNFNVRRSTRRGSVTLFTRVHGRGLDFIAHDKDMDQQGGVHVLQTFLSEEYSEEVQIIGRTARQDNKGTYSMVLYSEQLGKYGVTAEQLAPLLAGGNLVLSPKEAAYVPPPPDAGDGDDLGGELGGGGDVVDIGGGKPARAMTFTCTYDYLHHRRVQWFDTMSMDRSNKVANARKNHEPSMQFRDALVGLARLAQADPAAARAASPQRRAVLEFLLKGNAYETNTKPCRIMCLSDATMSMDPLWAGAKENIETMLQRVREVAGAGAELSINWVAYRDYDQCEYTAEQIAAFFQDKRHKPCKLNVKLPKVGETALDLSGAPDAVAKLMGQVNTNQLKRILVSKYGEAPAPASDGTIVESSGWQRDAAALLGFVEEVECRGGGDHPEAIEKALEFANAPFRHPERFAEDGSDQPTRVILIADAPPHAERAGEELAHHGRTLTTDYRAECEGLREHGVPVFSFYMRHPRAEEHHMAELKNSFTEIADLTGGEVQLLDVENDPRTLIDAVCLPGGALC